MGFVRVIWVCQIEANEDPEEPHRPVVEGVDEDADVPCRAISKLGGREGITDVVHYIQGISTGGAVVSIDNCCEVGKSGSLCLS